MLIIHDYQCRMVGGGAPVVTITTAQTREILLANVREFMSVQPKQSIQIREKEEQYTELV